MACARQPCPDHTVCPEDPPVAPIVRWEPCFICGEKFDPVKDPHHRDACRDAQKP